MPLGHRTRRESLCWPLSAPGPDYHVEVFENDLVWPFGKIHGLDRSDIRETAYEIFFTACRSSPGFGGRNPLSFYSSNPENGDWSPAAKHNAVVATPNSRVKRALGLKMLRESPSNKMGSGGNGGGGGSAPSSPSSGSEPSFSFTVPGRPRRPMTSAEIMRQQMKVTEQDDKRLRKTLMRTLVGQMGKRAETIILPLELLRHLKPSEFDDTHEYHIWQKRQLKILEAGLLLHPSIPLEKSNPHAMRLRETVHSGEQKPIDTGKNSDTLRTLSNSVVSLSWRSPNGCPADICHWADGFPLNVHLYVALLESVFDTRDGTLVLDEVDELLELMKKTWSTLGIDRPIHNLCFGWVLFQQYITTAQLELDLLCAAHRMLTDVANDVKKDGNSVYVNMVSSVLGSIQKWAEKRLLHYHDNFQRGTIGTFENLLPLAVSALKILGQDLKISNENKMGDSSCDRVDQYIRSSIKSAFAKMVDNYNFKDDKKEVNQSLLQLAKDTEELAMKEREFFTPILKKWHPTAGAVAALTLHSCYGIILKQYLEGSAVLNDETMEVLNASGKLENVLVQMVVEESADCDDGGKSIVREMVPYEVESITLSLLKKWVDNKLIEARECLHKAKESETWNPKSKSEPYAQSAAELVKIAEKTADEFFQVPVGITEDLVKDFADALEHLFQEYITFVAACGSKQSYIPQFPPLTRCNRDSKFGKLWKIATPCGTDGEEIHQNGTYEGHHSRPSTSRGTQRLYIRLNTLHYLSTHMNSLDKTLSLSSRIAHKRASGHQRSRTNSFSYFESVNSSFLEACQHVSEVAASRLIFLDSSSVFYGSLYFGDVANARIRPALRVLKQNLTLLRAILTERAQASAIKEAMKSSFEVYLMVLLAGGISRVFYRSDHRMIEEDFQSLKKVFCTCVEGLIDVDIVEKEAEKVEEVIELMGESTEQLIEDFGILALESPGVGAMGCGQKLPMPSTTGRWKRGDPNTILRVLCYRNDRVANLFLKRTFHLAKRR